jgi:hypothetical protein
VSTQQKELSIADDHIRFFQLSAPGPYGFDFPAFQRYSGLEAFLDEIIVERLSVFNDTPRGFALAVIVAAAARQPARRRRTWS